MGKDHYERARAAATSITGQRFCTNCRMNQNANGGIWKTSLNGRNRRWKCQLCVDKKRTIAAVLTAETSDAVDSAGADSSTSQPAGT